MKELKVKIPKGYEIDYKKSTFENIVFKKGKEKVFLELLQDLNICLDKDKSPTMFVFSKDKFVMEIEGSVLWVSYFDVWFPFEKEFGMRYSDIQEFIKDMVGKHFKLKGLTPRPTGFLLADAIEKSFK